MRILVTGGSGFIGRWLCSELSQHGHEVLSVDRVPFPSHDFGQLRYGHFDPGYGRVDLLQPHGADNVIRGLKPEVVVHLAAQVGRLFGEQDWRHTIESNAIMTSLVAAATAKAGARLVYTSTSEVYGDQRHSLCDEIDGPFALPHNLYGLSKRWGEEAASLYAPEALTVVRPSMPYGPGVEPGKGRAALPNILWQAHTRQDIPIHRGAKRSWTWIGDAVRGFRLIIEKGKGGTFNLGRDDAEIEMRDAAVIACAMTDAPTKLIQDVTPPRAQTVVKRLSTDRLRALGWSPEVELKSGMWQVLDWVKQFDGEGNRIHERDSTDVPASKLSAPAGAGART